MHTIPYREGKNRGIKFRVLPLEEKKEYNNFIFR